MTVTTATSTSTDGSLEGKFLLEDWKPRKRLHHFSTCDVSVHWGGGGGGVGWGGDVNIRCTCTHV